MSLKSVLSIEGEKEMASHAFVKEAGEDTMKKYWEVHLQCVGYYEKSF